MRTGTTRKRVVAPDTSVATDVIGRTGVLVRVRAHVHVVRRLDFAVGDRVIVEAGFETVAADVIGVLGSGVLELRLVAEVDRATRGLTIRRAPESVRQRSLGLDDPAGGAIPLHGDND